MEKQSIALPDLDVPDSLKDKLGRAIPLTAEQAAEVDALPPAARFKRVEELLAEYEAGKQARAAQGRASAAHARKVQAASVRNVLRVERQQKSKRRAKNKAARKARRK